MKTLLVGLILMSSFTSFAGTLLNKRTGESIDLNLDQESSKVEVVSRATGLKSKTVPLERMGSQNVDYDTALMYFSDSWYKHMDSNGTEIAMLYIFLPVAPISLAANAMDVLVLPVKGAIRFFKNRTNAKDYRKLHLAIVSRDGEVVEVNPRRFKRIVGILNELPAARLPRESLSSFSGNIRHHKDCKIKNNSFTITEEDARYAELSFEQMLINKGYAIVEDSNALQFVFDPIPGVYAVTISGFKDVFGNPVVISAESEKSLQAAMAMLPDCRVRE